MPQTNDITAQAATINVQSPMRDLRLIGVFQNATNDYVLIRTHAGEMIRLSTLIPIHDLRLISIGDGSAIVQRGDTVHRLIVG